MWREDGVRREDGVQFYTGKVQKKVTLYKFNSLCDALDVLFSI